MANYRIHSCFLPLNTPLIKLFGPSFVVYKVAFIFLRLTSWTLTTFVSLHAYVKSSPKIITLIRSIKHLEGAHFTTKENVLVRGGQISNFILDICYDLIRQIISKQKCLHCVTSHLLLYSQCQTNPWSHDIYNHFKIYQT